DWFGALLLAVWLGLMLFLLYRGNYLGWLVSTPICLALAGVAATTVLYVWRQLTAPAPYMPLSGFTFWPVTLAMECSAFWAGSLYGVAIMLPRYLLFRDYQQWKAGWVLLPLSLVLFAAMFVGGLVPQRSRYVWQLRLGLTGMTVMGFWLTW